jgi:Domain of unknown function (DUF4293)
MIQRKQTLWLLLAALINVGLFLFDLYRVHVVTNGVDTILPLKVNDKFFFVLIALVTIVLPAIAIFMYKDRKRQRLLGVLSVIACLSFISTMLMQVSKFSSSIPAASGGTYWIASVLPVISIIFLVMAIRGINKDEKLVKSQDRLR